MEKARRKPSVLAVDDDRGNLLALEATLMADFELFTAGSGAEALAILEASCCDVDVILMDVQMPGMDGFEATALIKALPGCGNIPVAFITAVYNEDPFVRQGYKAGGVDYFGKPFDPDILKLKLGNYASFRHQAAMLAERERRIRESEELLDVGRKLSAILEHMRVGVAVCDALGQISHANEEFQAVARDLAAPGDAGLLGRAIGQGTTCHDSIELRSSGGASRSIVRMASPLRDPGGRVTGAVLVVHDMTERRQVQIDLERRISRLVSPEAPVGAD